MGTSIRKIWVLGLFLLIGSAAANATPVHVTANVLDAGPNPVIDNLNFYVGPYDLSVDGVDFLALCVDFQHAASVATPYDAYESNIATGLDETYVSLGFQEMGTALNIANAMALAIYREEAYLFYQITTPGISGDQRIAIQHAAWAITDPNFSLDGVGTPNTVTDPHYWYNLALTNTVDYFGQVEVISGVAGTQQEFLIDPQTHVPEPGFAGVAGVALLALGAVRRLKRA